MSLHACRARLSNVVGLVIETGVVCVGLGGDLLQGRKCQWLEGDERLPRTALRKRRQVHLLT